MGVGLAAFVVDGARGVYLLHDAGHVGKVFAHAGFVAQRPDNDGGVVLVALHHGPAPRHKRVAPFGAFGNVVALVPQLVTLDIGLVDYVKAIFVAEVIPVRHVGVVAGAYGVDVILLHQFDVLHHAFAADHAARVGVELVAVHALKRHGLPIDKQLAAAHVHFAETHFLTNGFLHYAVHAHQLQGQRVQIRYFCRP